MERVNNLEDIKNLHDNKIIGNPKLNNAKINFTGKNNTLVNVFIYEFVNEESLNLNTIDRILNELAIPEKIEFIEKLFIKNKYKNIFAIQ